MVLDVISIIGTIASVWGAAIAIIEARKAKKSASEAEQIKNAISIEQKKIALSKLFTETKKAMSISIKMTTQANPTKKIRGLDYQSSIHLIREFVDILKENSHYVDAEKKQSLEMQYAAIEKNLVSLAVEGDQQKKYEIGDLIHSCMGEIIKVIKPELDVPK